MIFFTPNSVSNTQIRSTSDWLLCSVMNAGEVVEAVLALLGALVEGGKRTAPSTQFGKGQRAAAASASSRYSTASSTAYSASSMAEYAKLIAKTA